MSNLKDKNILVVKNFIEAALIEVMQTTNKATNEGVKLEFDKDNFHFHFKGQLQPAIESYLNLPVCRSSRPSHKLAHKIGKTLGFVIETGEFALSLLPFGIGENLYNGLKDGHVNAYRLHSKCIRNLSHTSSEIDQKIRNKTKSFLSSDKIVLNKSEGTPAPAVP